MHWLNYKKCINRKTIPENENPNKTVDIIEKILDFNKQQKVKGLPRMLASRPSDLACIGKVSNSKHIKILAPKQMIQRLPIAIAQVKVG